VPPWLPAPAAPLLPWELPPVPAELELPAALLVTVSPPLPPEPVTARLLWAPLPEGAVLEVEFPPTPSSFCGAPLFELEPQATAQTREIQAQDAPRNAAPRPAMSEV
jgi:hypothetical protein